jgi:hypothetical protein
MGAYAVVNYTNENTTESKRQMQAQILEMRCAGLGFEHIGRQLGVTHKYVYKLYAEALNAIIAPGVADLRKQEGERLDAMLIPLMSVIMDARNKAMAGEKFETPTDEITLALRVSERRARIFGLDAPTKVVAQNAPTLGHEMLQNLNLSTMDTAELVQFRDLLAKASMADQGADHADGT